MAGVIQDLLVTYHNMAEPSVRRQVVVTLPNSAWFGCAKREAVQAGPAQPVEWSKTELAREVPTERVAPFGTEAAAVDGAGASTMIGGALRGRTPLEQELAPSLVTVDFTRPFVINGIRSNRYRGTGVVVDAELGLVCVDRNTVPSGLGDVSLTFANTETVTGKVVYVRDGTLFQYACARTCVTNLKPCPRCRCTQSTTSRSSATPRRVFTWPRPLLGSRPRRLHRATKSRCSGSRRGSSKAAPRRSCRGRRR